MFFANDLPGDHDPELTEEGNHAQTGYTDQDDSYTFMWGKNQALVKQSDGNTFVINIERDGDFYPQDQDDDYINSDFDMNSMESEINMQTDDYMAAYTEMQPCSLLLPADGMSRESEYCGLDLLADLCEQKSRSVVPDNSTETDQSGNIVGHRNLQIGIGCSASPQNIGDPGVASSEGSDMPVCKIVDSFSLGPSKNELLKD